MKHVLPIIQGTIVVSFIFSIALGILLWIISMSGGLT